MLSFIFHFLGMLPTLTVSLLIWHKLYISTMPIATYLSAAWLIASSPIIYPYLKELFGVSDLMKWWFSISSGLWLIILFLLHLANWATKETLKWSLNFDALVYSASIFLVWLENYQCGFFRNTIFLRYCEWPNVCLSFGCYSEICRCLEDMIIHRTWKFSLCILFTILSLWYWSWLFWLGTKQESRKYWIRS